MELKSKFNINDVVYFMNRNKPVKATISGVTVSIGTEIQHASIGTTNKIEYGNGHVIYHFKEIIAPTHENLVYATREGLMEATFKAL